MFYNEFHQSNATSVGKFLTNTQKIVLFVKLEFNLLNFNLLVVI